MTTRLAAVLAVAAASAVNAQAPGRLPFNGSELFRYALYQHKIEPYSLVNQALNRPETSMIVVFGDLGRAGMMVDHLGLREYVHNGGAVLVATDGSLDPQDRRWVEQFGVQVRGSPVTADPRHLYNGQRGRVFVSPVRRKPGVRGPSPFDVFRDVPDAGPSAVATDHPSEMTLLPHALARYAASPLAVYPDGATRLRDGARVPDQDKYFAISLQQQPWAGPPAGRLLVVADRGVFVNGMMGFVKDDNDPRGFHLDNGNWEFAQRTIKWLQAGQPAPRTHCLFVEDGEIIDRFAQAVPNVNRPPVPKIPPDVLANGVLNAMNPLIDAAQERNFFNRLIDSWLGLPRAVRFFLLTATLIFLFAGVRWLLRGRRRAEAAAVMTPQLQAGLLPRGGILRQRTAAQIEVGNLYDAARRRVRERFDVLGGRPGPSGQMPPVLTANDLPDGPVLHHSVRWLWALGYGDTPVGIPPADWDRTNVLLERVTARAARGDWSFGQEV